jgi:hypothetical protein
MSETPLNFPLRLAAIVCLGMLQISCSTNCGVADTVSIVDSRDGNFLVYRVSGLQDKMEFFEVYRSAPKFDSCGAATTPAIAKEAYLRSEGMLKKVELHGDQLAIAYTQKASESIKPEQARLSP